MITIVLPTFNRAAFLPQAFASIGSQTRKDWCLIVVDDGSTDGTKDLVSEFAGTCKQPVRYVRQENHGAYSARNRGLEQATSEYIAFFDSDDVWLPDYLARCVDALERAGDVACVYVPCRMVESATGTQIEPNTFYVNGEAKPFLALKTRKVGPLSVIADRALLECHLLHGLSSGLQNSVYRRASIGFERFEESSRVIDDQHFVARMIARGCQYGYLADPQVIYHVHSGNSSGSSATHSAEKQIDISMETVAGLERIGSELPLTRRERRALLKRLSREYFWHLGYHGLWPAGRRREALTVYGRSLFLWPWDLARWKTYIAASARTLLHLSPQA